MAFLLKASSQSRAAGARLAPVTAGLRAWDVKRNSSVSVQESSTGICLRSARIRCEVGRTGVFRGESLLLMRGPQRFSLTAINLSNGVQPFYPISVAEFHTAVHLASDEEKSKARPTIKARHMDDDVETERGKIKAGHFDTFGNPEELEHFNIRAHLGRSTPVSSVVKQEPVWTDEELCEVEITHTHPEKFVDHVAFYSVKLLRTVFDLLSGFNRRERKDQVWINRVCFLETVAGVPGMVAAMTRHLHSLRRMRKDHGWIHTLLEEAENERMHLMTALALKQPSFLFRLSVVMSQAIFVAFFSISYIFSPRYCHRFVGYLEEEAVITYTKCLKDIEDGPMTHWQTQEAPPIAMKYWQLKPGSTMQDVILAIRADEAHHRIVNHTLASLKEDDYNPYGSPRE